MRVNSAATLNPKAAAPPAPMRITTGRCTVGSPAACGSPSPVSSPPASFAFVTWLLVDALWS